MLSPYNLETKEESLRYTEKSILMATKIAEYILKPKNRSYKSWDKSNTSYSWMRQLSGIKRKNTKYKWFQWFEWFYDGVHKRFRDLF